MFHLSNSLLQPSKLSSVLKLSAATYLFVSAGSAFSADLDLSGTNQNWTNSANITTTADGVNMIGNGNDLSNNGNISSDQTGILVTGTAVDSVTFDNDDPLDPNYPALADGNNITNSANIVAQDDAIAVIGSGNTVVNRGQLSAGENLDNILNGAAIPAVDNNDNGVEMEGDNNTIVNYGTVRASDDGLDIEGNAATINNYGDVLAYDDAIDITGDNASVSNVGTLRTVYGSGIELSGASASVSNSGLIETDRAGIDVSGTDAAVTNTGDIVSNDDDGLRVVGSRSSIVNRGTVTGNGGDGIFVLGSEADIYNYGRVDGFSDGIYVSGSFSRVNNFGDIYGGDAGIEMSGDAVVVQNSGNIYATSDGIQIRGDGVAVINSGSISAPGDDGIDIDGNLAYVHNTGDIVAYDDAIDVFGNNALIENHGYLESLDTEGVIVRGDNNIAVNYGTIISYSDGMIADDYLIVDDPYQSHDNILINYGFIQARHDALDAIGDRNLLINYGEAVTRYSGLEADGDGNTVLNFGSINANADAINFDGSNGEAANFGSIVTSGRGFYISGVRNEIANAGTISAQSHGIYAGGSLNNIYNSGIISSADAGIWVQADSRILIENSGSIDASSAGISIAGDTVRVVNSGRVFVDNHLVNSAFQFRDFADDVYLALNAGSHIQGRIEFTGTNNTLHMGAGWDAIMTITGDMAQVTVTDDGQPVVVNGQRVISVNGDGAAATAINASRLRAELTGAVHQDIDNRIEAVQRCEEDITYCDTGWWSSSRVAAQDGTSDNPYSHVLTSSTAGIDAALDQGGMAGLLGGISFSRSDATGEKWGAEATTAYLGGYYSRMFGSAFANFSLMSGYMWQDNGRVFYDNTVLGGIAQADGQSIGNTFVTPAVTLGYRADVMEGFTLVPTIGARYTFSAREGYTEELNSNISVDAQQEHRVDVRAQLALDWDGFESGDFGKWNARLRGGVDLYKTTTIGEGSSAYGTVLNVSDQSDAGARPFFGVDISYDLGERFDVSVGVEAAYDTNEVFAASGRLSSSLKF